MRRHLHRLSCFVALGVLFLLAPACGEDDEGGSEFEAGGSAGTGTGGSGNIGGLAGAGATGGGGSGGSATDGGGDAAGSSGSGGSGGDCTAYGQGEECSNCLDQNCCAEATACANSTDCNGMIECARACPNPTDTSSQCVQDCATQHNLGGSAYNPLVLCMGGDCGSVCPYF
jgi:hypothetical protein